MCRRWEIEIAGKVGSLLCFQGFLYREPLGIISLTAYSIQKMVGCSFEGTRFFCHSGDAS